MLEVGKILRKRIISKPRPPRRHSINFPSLPAASAGDGVLVPVTVKPKTMKDVAIIKKMICNEVPTLKMKKDRPREDFQYLLVVYQHGTGHENQLKRLRKRMYPSCEWVSTKSQSSAAEVKRCLAEAFKEGKVAFKANHIKLVAGDVVMFENAIINM